MIGMFMVYDVLTYYEKCVLLVLGSGVWKESLTSSMIFGILTCYEDP